MKIYILMLAQISNNVLNTPYRIKILTFLWDSVVYTLLIFGHYCNINAINISIKLLLVTTIM